MPRQIYPGVYVLDLPKTEAYASSRAGKYTTSYTEARYENWGLSLKQAELAYKKDYDAYTARDKALKDVLDAAQKDLVSAERTLASLQKEDRTTEDKQKTIEASRATEHDKWKASEAGKDRRVSVMAKAPKGTDETNTSTIAADAAAPVNSPSDYHKGADRYVANTNDPTVLARSGISTPAQIGFTAKQTIEGMAAKTGQTVDEVREGLIASGDDNSKQLANDYNLYTPTTSGGGTSSGKGNYVPTTPDLGDRSGVVKTAEEDVAAKKQAYAEAVLSRAGLTAPKPNLVESARDIYANQFETLPGYQKHKEDLARVESQKRASVNTRALVDVFIEDRKKKLGADATPTELLAAKTEGAKDALFFLQHKQLRGKAENKGVPILTPDGKIIGWNPAVPGVDSTVEGIPIGGQGIPEESIWDYIDGPKKGLPIPESLRASIPAVSPAPVPTLPAVVTPPAKPSVAPTEAEPFDLGDEEIVIKRKLPKDSEPELTGSVDSKDKVTGPSGRDYSKEHIKTEIKTKGPAYQEGRSVFGDIKEGHELSKQPKKVERLAATTSYGKYIKELYTANKAAMKKGTGQNYVQLREQILQNTPEGEQDAARKLLAAYMILDQ